MPHSQTMNLDDFDCHNLRYLEDRLIEFRQQDTRSNESWQDWFTEQTVQDAPVPDEAERLPPGSPFAMRSVFNPASNGVSTQQLAEATTRQHRITQLVEAFRKHGHLAAKIDALGMAAPGEPAALKLETYQLTQADLDLRCASCEIPGLQSPTLRQVLKKLRSVYCGRLAGQFSHIEEVEPRRWLQQRMEGESIGAGLNQESQRHILQRLTDAETFEQFVRKRYIGSKTFSLEGAESLIPLLDLAIELAGDQGVKEIVLGMAHRGRLNVITNIVGKQPRDIFWEFKDPRPETHLGGSDVKYHLGSSGDRLTQAGKKVHLSLCFNPSHLEFVNPVALGRLRAKQDRGGNGHERGMAVLIHGDAGFAGEGIVQETLNLSQLAGYSTGGTLHVIVNNQLGFTTPPAEGRSARYCSDVARLLQVPIFHVNGEYPEAVARAVELAMEFRAAFQRDAVIVLYCYRKWGHNESDEPGFTQPQLYQAIEHREPVRDKYLEHLLELESVTQEEADEMEDTCREELSRQFEQSQDDDEYHGIVKSMSGVWSDFAGSEEPDDDNPETGVEVQTLSDLLHKLTQTPDSFHVHRKLQRSIERRRKMADGELPVDWSAAEALALATLAVEGHRVRFAGQDTARGTFSQRHAVLHDVVDGHQYEIFQHLAADQAPVEVINSPLCEAGAMAFEYGYSLDYPEALVAWEAQYGDFGNAAQVIIDQFLASAEDKWRRLSGIVLLLPHGFEGMGPEHSSARLERFLNLAAEDNLQVAMPSTPAQLFHLLRRQVKRRWRKPLILFTPKSLLRNEHVVSPLEDLATGRFRRVLPEDQTTQSERVLLASGKMYFDLLRYREEHDHAVAALIRVEQFYPLREELLYEALADCDPQIPVTWVQEEPENQGAWPYWKTRFGERLGEHPLKVIARRPSASPATGSKGAHQHEQQELLQRAFGE